MCPAQNLVTPSILRETERNYNKLILSKASQNFSYNQKNIINIQFLCKIHWEIIILNLDLTTLSNAWNYHHFTNEEINVIPSFT